MKVLLDTCVWGKARVEIQNAGHDVVWAGDWPEDPGDAEILAIAHSQERVFVTLDKDFGDLAIHHGLPHHGIIRLVDLSSSEQARSCIDVLGRFGEKLLEGTIVTVEIHRLRVRPPGESS